MCHTVCACGWVGVCRIRLPQNRETNHGVILGEGKPENQNAAIIFCFGEIIQVGALGLRLASLLAGTAAVQDMALGSRREGAVAGSECQLAWCACHKTPHPTVYGLRPPCQQLPCNAHPCPPGGLEGWLPSPSIPC